MRFTEAEKWYMEEQSRGHLATISPAGHPQVKPVGFTYNDAEATIDISGLNMAESAKFRNVRLNPEVAFVIDDEMFEGSEQGVRFLEIRGVAEATIHPPHRDSHLAPEIIRIHPRRVLSYNVDPRRPGLEIRRDPGSDSHLPEWPSSSHRRAERQERVPGHRQ